MRNGRAVDSLTVRGARKQDAGRGLARVPESVRSELGALSGDPVLVEGPETAVATLRLARDDDRTVRIDAETRANAGVNVGDEVTLRTTTVDTADSLTVRLADVDEAVDTDRRAAAIRRALRDRLLIRGERVDVPGVGSFVVAGSDPTGVIRVTDRTTIAVEAPAGDDEPSTPASADTATGTDGTQRPSTGATYEDIGGLDDELDQIREMIELPLSEPELFQQLGIDPPKGVLLHGPPGTGKTLIARAVANEVDAHFEVISGPEIVSKYKGESEERLREAFERAAANAPAIVFVDELDSIAGTRDEDADMENRVVAQLLTLLDGLEDRGRVIVVGATNRIDAVDTALRRGGRFDREIEIGVPDEGGRREILEVHTRGVPLGADVDLDWLAAHTHGFVGADLGSLVTEAAMAALRRSRDSPTVTRADFEAALAGVEPSAMREYVSESPTVTFDDVGGLDAAKQTLTQTVQWPLSYGALFEATKTEPPTGVLLYGPPGTGKTLLARAIAGESGVNFISAAGAELLDRYVGESEKAVRELFERARQTAPTVLFLDELDAVASVRGEGHEVTQRVVSQLLTELDAAADNPNLVVLAATNRMEALDPALLRPGRFEAHVEVPLPDHEARRAILDVHTREKPLDEDVDLDELADDTEGFSGAELESLVREASLLAITDLTDDIGPEAATEQADEIRIGRDHFERARDGMAD
ncbi:AAA family ATPase [Haloarculaceae archaeon H-GB2-1]|nr:AAA family ATPase [Haloarculaceae archaeon H-GB1-1]MEA5387375.1 AAA family ATPase [Haloarculaceae archaeon H-GB11]MEA5408846.1 AAA family ATPase [Haloarculaceae archaeon H-GB2-1]